MYRTREWGEDCWVRIFALFRGCNLQWLRSKQEESAEEEDMKQQQIMKEYEGFDEENQIKRVELTLRADGGLLSCLRQIARKRGFIQGGKTPRRNGVSRKRK